MTDFANELWPGTRLGRDGRPYSKDFCRIHNCASIAQFSDGSWRCLLCETHDRMYSEPDFNRLPCHRDYEDWLGGKFMQRVIGR
jgi:hypothetical protein